MARQVRIDVGHREPIQTNMVCTKISPFVRGNISTNSVKKISRYISLSISQPELHPFTEKVQPSNRFYYYSDSNIKVKSCEEPPSPQPCPFFLQRTGQLLFLVLTDGLSPMHSTLFCWEIRIKADKPFYYFFAFSSSSNMYLSKSDMNNLS